MTDAGHAARQQSPDLLQSRFEQEFDNLEFGDNDFFGTGPSKYAGLVAATYLDGADAFFGGRVELETSINRFDRKRDNDDPGCDLDDPDQNVCLRQGNFWVASRTFGKISVGRAETPSNGIWYTSFGGNAFATSSLPTRKAGNHDIDGLFIPFGVATFEDLGKEHHDIIRYDSPTIGIYIERRCW